MKILVNATVAVLFNHNKMYDYFRHFIAYNKAYNNYNYKIDILLVFTMIYEMLCTKGSFNHITIVIRMIYF